MDKPSLRKYKGLLAGLVYTLWKGRNTRRTPEAIADLTINNTQTVETWLKTIMTMYLHHRLSLKLNQITVWPKVEECSAAYEDILEEHIDSNGVKEVVNVLMLHGDMIQIFGDFICTLAPESEDTVTNRALQYYSKAKNIWENQHFVEILQKTRVLYDFPDLRRCMKSSQQRLSEFIVRKIKSESLSWDIFDFQDRVAMMRNGLSVLIGYWSNEEMIARMLSMGGHSLRTLLKGEERSENKSPTPVEVMSLYYPILDLRQDSSIMELADKLSNVSEAVTLTEKLLRSLQGVEPLREYYRIHYAAAGSFWGNPSILMELIEALKESMPLVKVFKKYSQGAQVLRCVQGITRIQKDPLLCSILTGDPAWKMRGALSILFGYTGDTVVCEYSSCIRVSGFEINKDHDVQIFEYLAHGPGDVEGLKNVLVENSKDLKGYNDIFKQIMEMKQPRITKRNLKSMTKEMKEKAAMDAMFKIGLIKVMLRNERMVLYRVKPLIPLGESYTHYLK